jgi:acyl dehydratase
VLDYEALLNWQFDEIRQCYTEKDSILYALGLGIGHDPTDSKQLRFVYEKGLVALPTMSIVLGYPGQYLRDPALGTDWKRLVHGEQRLLMHRPLPPAGDVTSINRIEAVIDKGPDRGALVYSTREMRDTRTGDLISAAESTAFLRGDGGFGGPSGPLKAVHEVPRREPDEVASFQTLPQAALIYRLSGDLNPIHADPGVAAEAGFERPILHGLCTYGIAGYVLTASLCDHRPERVRRLDVRFSAPVIPGDAITTSIWHERPGAASFRCCVQQRSVCVIDNGYFEFEP